MKNIKNTLFAWSLALTFASCGGGGGGGSSSPGGNAGGDLYLIQAPVTVNGCRDRIAPVTQEFLINTNGDIATVDTTVATASGTYDSGNLVAGYAEANGGCTRNHTISISGLNDDAPQVLLSSETACDNGQTCTNTWTGTASRIGLTVLRSDEGTEKVRGENCIQPISNVGYRPSVFECNGTAAVLLRGRERNNYSVVVRRNGQFNDRDPNNPTCGTNECSPYKTQKRMELSTQQVNCLGDSGFSALYDPVVRMSIKFSGLVTNPNDPNQFEQYCIANPESSFN